MLLLPALNETTPVPTPIMEPAPPVPKAVIMKPVATWLKYAPE